MSTVHAPASRFNPTTPVRTSPDDNCPSLIPTDRAYESLAVAMAAEDDARALAYWAEFEQGMSDHEDDMACERADDVHAGELAAAVVTAKESAGVADVTVSRTLEHSSKAGRRVVYHARVDAATTCHFGAGDSHAAAVASLLHRLDEATIAAEFGGFKVTGLAFVSGFPHRSRDEARQLARRIVIDPAYLDVALALHLDGLTDLRPRPAAAVAAA